MKYSRIIDRLVTVTLVCLCSIKVKAGCPKQLGKDAFPHPQRPIQGQEPQTCSNNTTCCTRQLEAALQHKALAELDAKVGKRLDGVKGSTSAIERDVKGYFQELIRNSKEASLQSLREHSHVNLSSIAVPLVTTMFNQLEKSIQYHDMNFTLVVLQFLKDSFPPLFNYATQEAQSFSDQFEKCIKKKVNFVQIFGAKPHRISDDIEKVMKPMQMLIKGLAFTEKIIGETKQLNFTKGCRKILLQMAYCSLCNGEDSSVKPCEGYCINVLKNCLVTNGKLQKQWGLFFDAMENLVLGLSTHSVKQTLITVYNRLSFDVIQVIPQIQNPAFKNKMYRLCGRPTYGKGKTTTKRMGQTSKTIIVNLRQKMQDVRTKMSPLRGVFEEMPRDICVYDRVSALRTEKVLVANCWNGTTIGRYVGPVSSPLPSLDTSSIDKSRIASMVQRTEHLTNNIKKHTPDYQPTEIEGSGGSGSGVGSGCDDDDEDCGSGSGSSRNSIETNTDTTPTVKESNDNDIVFGTADSPQDGGVNANAKGKSGQATTMPSIVLLITTLLLSI